MSVARLYRAPFTCGRNASARSRLYILQARAASSIRRIREGVASQETTARETVQGYLDRIRSRNEGLGAFLAVDDRGALSQADAIDAAAREGKALGPLAGVPFAVKDNICTQGLQTTAGSRLLEGHTPAYDAAAVARLRAAGAILVGKTNMDEFGMGSTNENSGYGPVRNPWDSAHVPGGSSGGSAAAVAASLVPTALGSDTGGSIRQPASFCGVVGLKPTYGRVSRRGLIAYASSLDCLGVLAGSAEDAAEMLAVMAGHDPLDATSSQRAVGNVRVRAPDQGSKPLAGQHFGIIAETVGEGVDAAVVEALHTSAAHLESLGATVEEVHLPSFASGLPAYYVIALSEASSNLSRYDGIRYGRRAPQLREMMRVTRHVGLGEEVQRRILMGTYALSAGYYDAFYLRAQQVRTLVTGELRAALARCDALLSPAAPTPAYRLGETATDPLAMYKGDVMTVNINLAGLPAITFPCGWAPARDGVPPLPIGLQLIGRPFGEAGLLQIAHTFECTNPVAQLHALPPT